MNSPLPPVPLDVSQAQRAFFNAMRQALSETQKRMAELEKALQALKKNT